jgi:c-di-GMP-binding flagellar brake protein YcgR
MSPPNSPPGIPPARGHTPPPFEKRRQYVRTPLRMSAEIHVGEGNESFTATTRDLSEGGCGLEFQRIVAEGAELTIGLFLVIDDVEDERVPPLWVKGRVVWTAEMDAHKTVAGVRFEVITEQQRAWVRQVLGHLAT